jgi:uncharacterized membrane protein YgaE (UPF0421/DUF939 family)
MKLSKIKSFLIETGVVWKTAIGSSASWKLAQLAGSSHPYLAPITLILCLQATLNRSIHFAVHRVFGTALGIFITVLLAMYFSVNYLTIGLLIFIGAAIGKLFKMSYMVIHQIALSILLVFTFAHQSPDYGIDRLRDTLIGALIAFALAVLIFPIDFTRKAKNTFYFHTDELIANFTAIAQWVANGCSLEVGKSLHKGTQNLLKDLHQLEDDLTKAIKDLHFSPYSKKHKKGIAFLNDELLHLKQGYHHISQMLRTLMEWKEAGSMTVYDNALWSSYFFSLAAHVSEWKTSIDTDEELLAFPAFSIAPPANMEKSLFDLSLYHDAMETIVDFMPPAKVAPKTT